jgi:hypothetical protein
MEPDIHRGEENSMTNLRRRRPGAGLVVSVIALIVALSGTSYAAFSLPNNSVTSRQLRNGAVTTRKLKNRSVTAAKINFRGVTVPNAKHANTATFANQAGAATHAGFADNAGTASMAKTADSATSLQAPESFRIIGAPGEPAFQNSWGNGGGNGEPAAFFKDHEGIVHLQGNLHGGAGGATIFQLPPGYRPASGKVLRFAAVCTCVATDPQGGEVSVPTGQLDVEGPGVSPTSAGVVLLVPPLAPPGYMSLDGITFRAAS